MTERMVEQNGVLVYKEDRDMSKMGNFYILKKSGHTNVWRFKIGYTLIGEDFSWVNCNGDTRDRVIAYSTYLAPLRIWAACNGIDVDSGRPSTNIRRHISFD